jgi:hypothetical protein
MLYFLSLKMNAVIKMGHTQYLQVLEELLFSRVHPRDPKIQVVKLPFFNLIALLVSIYTEYTQQTLVSALNLYILHYFVYFSRCRETNIRVPSNVTGIWKAC